MEMNLHVRMEALRTLAGKPHVGHIHNVDALIYGVPQHCSVTKQRGLTV